MHYYHLAFGLRIRADLAIPGLTVMQPLGDFDLEVRLAARAGMDVTAPEHVPGYWTGAHVPLHEDPAVSMARSAQRACYRFYYTDGTEFIIDRDGTRITASWVDPLTLEDTATYLLGPILGFVLRLRGTLCLHASAIEIGEGAALLVGPAGSGKSTTAAAFALAGYRVLADDVAPIGDCPAGALVIPAYPRLRLWPEAAAFLCGSREALPPLTPNWDKLYLDLAEDGRQFPVTPVLARPIYLLGSRENNANAPRIEALPPAEGFMGLVANTYATRFLDAEMRRAEFRSLQRLCGSIPIRRLVPHSDPTRISQVCDLVVRDAENLLTSCTAA